MRQVTERGLKLVMRFERFMPRVYLCPTGYETIGYGHVILPGERFTPPLSHDEAMALLRADMAKAERAVSRLISVPLTDGQFDALCSFTFNLGAGALQRSTLRRKVNRGEHDTVPQEFMRWVYGGGKKLPGLVRRRAAEAALYGGG